MSNEQGRAYEPAKCAGSVYRCVRRVGEGAIKCQIGGGSAYGRVQRVGECVWLCQMGRGGCDHVSNRWGIMRSHVSRVK